MTKVKSRADLIQTYIKELNEKLKRGDSTEHTHRAALQRLLEAFSDKLVVTNEPKHIKVGAPDFIIRKRLTRSLDLPVGYIETKDIGVDLRKIEKTDQLKRYFQLDNLILTDYLEFRWYVDGKLRTTAVLGKVVKGRAKLNKEGEAELLELLKGFSERDVTGISSPQVLAKKMAGLCRQIDRIIVNAFKQKEASDLLRELKDAFEHTLLPDLSETQFADMFAQTLAYGLFAARVSHHQHAAGKPFERTGAAREIPGSNPFLKKLFYTIHSPELDSEPFIGFVEDLTLLLHHTEVESVLAHFGKRTGHEDPILHFYETFLSAYDPKERKRRGVYYTPEPVVSYIVRSVDILLKEKFGLPGGLADESTIEVEVREGDSFVKKTLPKVMILDPACGTGTFLYAVIDLIRNRFREEGRAGEWPGYVKQHLIPRIYGFELQMAPYAVAHLKLAMQLAGQDLEPAEREAWAYEFGKDERLNIFLTNSLEYTDRKIQMSLGFLEKTIAEEAGAAQQVKGELPIMVVMGNPPYSGNSANKGDWIKKLVRDYYFVDGKPLGERNSKMLQDDYVKFIRFGQWRIENTGHGILGFVTNHGYIDNPTFRGMRQSLLKSFSDIMILDLHGNSKKKEKAPDGGKEENVFDIQQGVTIGVFSKGDKAAPPQSIKKADLFGQRHKKYKWLVEHSINTTQWVIHSPEVPFYRYDTIDQTRKKEFYNIRAINSVFMERNTGVTTHRDHIALAFNSAELSERLGRLRDDRINTERLFAELNARDTADWQLETCRAELKKLKDHEQYSTSMLYRPFDHRAYFRHSCVVTRPREEIMKHMLPEGNLGLVTTRQTREKFDSLATRIIPGHKSVAAYDRNYLFPLYLYPDESEKNLQGRRRPNLDGKFVAEFAGKLGLEFVEEGAPYLEASGSGHPGTGASAGKKRPPPRRVVASNEVVASSDEKSVSGGKKRFGPEDVFYYIYAVFHSPTYRERNKEFLKIDFPRVPLTSDKKLFGKLVRLGYELTQYHLLESPELAGAKSTFPVRGDDEVGKVRYDDKHKRVYINKDQYFTNVAPAVWEFHVGGYQVCHKWLKDRKGRVLSHDDKKHYEKVVMALGETIRLMKAIDRAIPEWPIQ